VLAAGLDRLWDPLAELRERILAGFEGPLDPFESRFWGSGRNDASESRNGCISGRNRSADTFDRYLASRRASSGASAGAEPPS
jgi:hypothetical protein